MGEYRCVLLATVLKVHNSIPLYPYCKRCYSKLVFDSKKKIWKCSQCSNRMKDVDVTYRFRLSMSVADRCGVADVCIFGHCLNNIFGSTADNFQRYLRHIEVSHPDINPNSILQSAEANIITGNQFYFGFKVVRKTGIDIKGLDDLVEHHSKDHMPRSIVACQAIQPFQNSQHLTIIQYLKHWIHCLSKTTITDSCLEALCCCNHDIDDRKQCVRRSSTFLCSGSSTESNSQRNLAKNSLVLSYEESLQASNSQRIHSQPSAVSVDVKEHSPRESLQSLKDFHESETVWEDGFYSCTLNNGAENHLIDSFMCINNFTNHEDNKSVHQMEDNKCRIINCQQASTSSVKSNESTAFPDDLPFSEDLELFLERVDARHAEGAIGSPNGSINAKELSPKINKEDCAEHYSVANPAKSTKTLQTALGEPLDNDVSQIREPNSRNLTYLNELPFPEDFESFVQHLESKNEGETPVSCKLSPICTHVTINDSSNINTNKENLSKLQFRRNPNCGGVSGLKRQVANHLTHVSAGTVSETLHPCRFSTPIQVPLRTGFRKNCKRRLQHQLKSDLTDSPQQNSHCEISNTEKEASHKKLLKHPSCPQNSVLGDITDRNFLDLSSDLQVFNNSTFELFSSQSLISPCSVDLKSQIPLKKRTTSLSKDLMKRRLQSNVIETQRKLSHKSELLKCANKNTGLNHSNVCHTSDVKPNDHTSDIFTQQLFDSFSDVSSHLSLNLETKNHLQLPDLGRGFSPGNKIQTYFGNYPIEDLKNFGTIKNSNGTRTSGNFIEPASSELTSYHSPDLFSQSFSRNSCKVLESRQFCKTPDLFSSWSNDSHMVSDSKNQNYDDNLSMPLFSSFEDSSEFGIHKE